MEEDNRGTLLGKINNTDATSGSGVPAVKLSYNVRGVYTVPRFP